MLELMCFRGQMGIFFSVFFCIFLLACSDNESCVLVDMEHREALVPPRQGKAITYAYLPQYAHAISFERHRRLLSYLRQKTGLPFRQVFPDTFTTHIRMVERGEIDISFSNPFVYTALARAGSGAFARAVEKDSGAYFQGQIIVRRDNTSIRVPKDCRGKRLMAVDARSAGGYLYPMGYFREHGLTAQDFQEIRFASGSAGKQEAVVLAVYAGACDVGVIRKGTLDVVRGKIDISQIRVLAETKNYPGWVYSARRQFPRDLRQKIAEALFALSLKNPSDVPILRSAGMVGIIPARDDDYEIIRRLIAELGMQADGP